MNPTITLKDTKGEPKPTTTIRFPVELKEALQQIADSETRNFSGIVIHALTKFVESYDQRR